MGRRRRIDLADRLASHARKVRSAGGDSPVDAALATSIGLSDEAIARLMAEAGLMVLVALISPTRDERQLAREIAGDVDFLEIFVDAPLSVCEQRDPRGLYSKARHGQIAHFTGIDSPYEPPQAPHLHLRTDRHDAQTCVAEVAALLSKMRL